ncbi:MULTISPECIES: hypothetical protein [Serratia]|uniref:hypothetical protein n=1 Tax=Serratia TaxID=613 RepID=UPI0007456021|nr:hypothetical protein [Serratia marcescens]EME1465781.1 hypothetical protein [Serratia marcescens]MCW7559677.1 hypothetical protein [Serratia marcescens]MCW7564531.1 hypothetical protein [Serratia marcescens]MCW7569533.1 hypothetical protein [Serratia marcescens]MCW7574533.1 hypothetical protein [Serratia marcescens]
MKRFTPDCSMHMSHEMAFMRETPDGAYMEYQDHLAVKTQRDNLAARVTELELVLQGLPQAAIDGSWTAKGISDYAQLLEARLAVPVRLPTVYLVSDGKLSDKMIKADEAVEAIQAAGFTVVRDGQ